MNEKLVELLHLELQPVGIFLGNTEIVCEMNATPDSRNCVVPFLMAAAQGTTAAIPEENCNCPGGTVGCCFGDGFTKKNPTIHKMLSQGYGDDAPPNTPPHMKYGERFFCSEKEALIWRSQMPYSEKGSPRVVFAPQSTWEELGKPDLVFVFANADQISALVTMLGSHNGQIYNTLVPYGAACHSILFAAEQMDQARPMAVMGLFDISQRRDALAPYLSLTMPYPLWEELGSDLEISCLTTHAWHLIEKRLP